MLMVSRAIGVAERFLTLPSVTGGVVESLQGGSFGHGFAAAGLTAAFMPQVGGYSAPVRAVLGALIGGTISAVTGGKFANGAISGAVQGVMAKRSTKTMSGGGKAPANAAIGRLAEKEAHHALVKSGFYKDVAKNLHRSEAAIAEAWGRVVLPIAERHNVEVGAWLAQSPHGAWSVSAPHSDGAFDWVQPANATPSFYKATGWVHTHPMLPGGEVLSGRNILLRSVNGEVVPIAHADDNDGDIVWAVDNEMNIYSYGGVQPTLSSFIYNDAAKKLPNYACMLMSPENCQ